MRILFLLFIFISGCRSGDMKTSLDDILFLQSIWDAKDSAAAFEKIPELRVIEIEDGHEALGVGDKITIFSLVIYVSQADKKISSIVVPLQNGEEISSQLIKEKLKADDWKTYEHPKRGIDYIQLDVTEYSEKLGVGFAYDKLDKEKKTRMIYWGVDPKNIQQIL
jgi:hypothetical protein